MEIKNGVRYQHVLGFFFCGNLLATGYCEKRGLCICLKYRPISGLAVYAAWTMHIVVFVGFPHVCLYWSLTHFLMRHPKFKEAAEDH